MEASFPPPSEGIPPPTSPATSAALAHALETCRAVRQAKLAALAGREISLITRALREEEQATHQLRQEMLEAARARARQHRRDALRREMRQVYVVRPGADESRLVTVHVPESFTASDLAAHSVAEGSGLLVQHRGRPLQPEQLLRDFPTTPAAPFYLKPRTPRARKQRLAELSDVPARAREDEELSTRPAHVRAASPRLLQLATPRGPRQPEPEPEPPGAARTMSVSTLRRLAAPRRDAA